MKTNIHPLLDKALSTPLWGDILVVSMLGLGLWILHLLVRSLIAKSSRISIETRRAFIVIQRNLLIVSFFVAAGFVFSSELRSLAISVAAVGAALVIVNKEGIANLIGGLSRTAAGWGIGEIVELNGVCGEIIDLSPFQTILLEMGEDNLVSGKTIVLPNSVFLTAHVKRHSFFKGYVFKTIYVAVPEGADPGLHLSLLETSAQESCSSFRDKAESGVRDFFIASALPVPDTSLVGGLRLDHHSGASVFVRFPCPRNDLPSVSKAILLSYCSKVARLPASPERSRESPNETSD